LPARRTPHRPKSSLRRVGGVERAGNLTKIADSRGSAVGRGWTTPHVLEFLSAQRSPVGGFRADPRRTSLDVRSCPATLPALRNRDPHWSLGTVQQSLSVLAQARGGPLVTANFDRIEFRFWMGFPQRAWQGRSLQLASRTGLISCCAKLDAACSRSPTAFVDDVNALSNSLPNPPIRGDKSHAHFVRR